MSDWLILKDIKRSFGAIHALKGVHLSIKQEGEVLGLLGENGAGKSTLVKIISGFDGGYEGQVIIHGKPAHLGTPERANELGIAIAQQELSLIPTLSVAENIFLGGNHGPAFASGKRLCDLAQPFLEEVGLQVHPETLVRRLSVGERHLIEVARLIAHKPQLLILDEPTAALGESDSQRILSMVRRLRDQGKSIIYVSHRLDEIFDITDRVTVLRDGMTQVTKNTADLNLDDLITYMLGRDLTSMFPEKPKGIEKKGKYQIKHLWPDRVLQPVTFEVREKEILGLAGQLGSGTAEILASLAGRHPVRSGSIEELASGKSFLPSSPKQAIKHKIVYCSPDRKFDGLFLGRPILENLSSPNLGRISKYSWIQKTAEWNLAQQIAKAFTIDESRIAEEASVLSGGNQQKVALGKWLSVEPNLILIVEPTRGVDVGARAEIYQKLRNLAQDGVSIIVASTDIQEIAYLPDRVFTFYKGLMTAELEGDALRLETILKNITHPDEFELLQAS